MTTQRAGRRHSRVAIGLTTALVGAVLVLVAGVATAHHPEIEAGTTSAECAPEGMQVSFSISTWTQNEPQGINDRVRTYVSTVGRNGPYTYSGIEGAIAPGEPFSGTFTVPEYEGDVWVVAEAQVPWGNGASPRNVIDDNTGLLREGALDSGQTMIAALGTLDCDSPAAPTATLSFACPDAAVTVQLTNSGEGPADFDITWNGDVAGSTSVSVAAGATETFEGITLAEGQTVTVEVTSESGAGFDSGQQTFTRNCEPDQPSASAAVACAAGDGDLTVTVTNPGSQSIDEIVVTVTGPGGPFSEIISSLAGGAAEDLVFDGLADGAYTIAATAGGEPFPVSPENVEVGCDPTTASLGDTVWLDQDRDGAQDAGEPGVPNVRVDLWTDDDGDGTPDTQVDSTTTDGDGAYGFGGLSSDLTYVVQFVPLANTAFTVADAGDDAADSDADPVTGITAPIDLAPGENDPSIDAGLIPAQVASGVCFAVADSGPPGGASNNDEVDTLVRIDVANGVLSSNVLGVITDADGAVRGVEAIAIGPSGTIFAVDDVDNELLEIVVLADGSFSTSVIGQLSSDRDVDGLTFIGNSLYATQRTANADRLLIIDTTNAAVTDIGPIVIDNLPAGTVQSVDDIAWDAGAGRLFGVIGDAGLNFLNVIDPATANGSLLSDLPAIEDIEGLSLSLGGNLFGTTGDEGSDRNHILVIDKTTGFGTTLGDLLAQTGLVDFEAIDCLPVTPVELASLGDTVWLDLDADGVQDDGEPSVPGVTVNLWTDDDGDGAPDTQIATTATDGEGIYGFAELDPDLTYVVEFVAPPGSQLTARDVGGDDAVDSDADPATGITGPIDLDPGENDPTIDAGLLPEPASLGDRVWLDLNADGVQDAGEPGVPGVAVNLWTDDDGDGTPDTQIDTTTTDGDGLYGFAELDPSGVYVVQFVTPDGTAPTLQDVGGDDSVDSDADPATGITGPIGLAPGENDPTIDAGLIVPSASLGDRVWFDDDADGVQDAGEPGVPGVTVNLWTDDDGDGDPDTLIAIRGTDDTGGYLFDGLDPDLTYVVEFVAAVGAELTVQDAGGDDAVDSDADPATGITGPIDLDPGENDPTIDAGIVLLASLGDRVWVDEDADGIQDAGEPGVADVTVNLWTDDDGDGTPDTQIDTTATDGDGIYGFAELDPALTYVVQFEAGPLTTRDAGGDDTIDSDADPATGITGPIDLDPGENDPTIDAGIIVLSSLGDTVWLDLDGDGTQDTGEPGVPGVTVNLWTDDDGDGAPDTQIRSTATGADGTYRFEDLDPRLTYVVQFVTDASFTSSDVGADDSIDSDADPATGITGPIDLAPGENDPTIDAGLLPVEADVDVEKATNGDDADLPTGPEIVEGDPVTWTFVVTNTGELDLVDVVVTDDIEGVICTIGFLESGSSDTCSAGGTAAVGQYANVASVVGDPVDENGDPAIQPDGTPVASPTDEDPSHYLGVEPEPASLGDRVWVDEDADGIQDAGEPGVADVTVNLWTDDDGDGGPDTQVDTTVTDADGVYGFGDLDPDPTYVVEFVPPTGTQVTTRDVGGDDAADSDADPVTGITGPVDLDPGENDPTIDAGIVPLASLGDRVWVDEDADGIQDAGEPGVADVTVNLWTDDDGDGGPDTQVDTTVTDADGVYGFGDLDPDPTYVVEFVPPPATLLTERDAGGDDAADSDADPVTGITGPIDLAPGENDPTIDAGIVPLASLGDTVWLDLDADGLQEPGEPGVPGVTVNLWTDDDGDGAPDTQIDSTATGGDGTYLYDDLDPRLTYIVQFDTGRLTSADQGDDDAVDSDADPATGTTGPIDLAPGETDPTIDAGIVPLQADVDVEKGTNGDDADEPTGPEIVEGDPVTWTYVVTNTGELDLVDVVVTDDVEGVICTVTSLSSGASDTCTASGTAALGQYANVASVVGDPVDDNGDPAIQPDGTPVASPTDEDPSHYVGVEPEPAALGDTVWFDEDADGIQDAGEPGVPGVTLNLWVDDDGDDIADTPIDTTLTDGDGRYLFEGLDPARTYFVEMVPPQAGRITFVDQGADDAVDSDIDPVTSISGPVTLDRGELDPTIDAGLIALEAAISIEKATDGVDADDPADGPIVEAGDPVEWTYEITNTGELDLANVVVTDDIEGPICALVFLAVGESSTCVLDGIAGDGLYVNIGDVTGDPFDQDGLPATDLFGEPLPPVTDDDPSAYVGFEPGAAGIDVEKATNGVDADDPVDGPLIAEGGEVLWSYVVTNTGGFDLADVVVTDDVEGLICTIPLLGVGEVVTCEANGTAQTGDYANLADVAGDPVDDDGEPAVDPDGSPVPSPTDTDPSHYSGFVAAPAGLGDTVWLDEIGDGVQGPDEPGVEGIDVVLWVDGDGDGAPDTAIEQTTTDDNGNYLFDGLDPDETYFVQVVGGPLTVQDAGDDDGLDSDVDPDTGISGPIDLDPGEFDDTIDAGILPAPSTAGLGDTVWIDADADGVQGPEEAGLPGVEVVLWIDDNDDGAPTTAIDSTTTDQNGNYLFEDLQTDEVYFVQVVPPAGGELTFPDQGADDSLDSDVDPVTGVTEPVDLGPGEIDLTIDAGILPLPAGITIVKTTNGVDTDAAPPPVVPQGDSVEWLYTVTNVGAYDLVAVAVVDDVEGDVCTIDFLAIGEVATCSLQGVASTGLYQNTGEVVGDPVDQDGAPAVDPSGTPVPSPTASDDSGYVGIIDGEAAIDIEKATNGFDGDDTTDRPSLLVGSVVEWTYTVTNIGSFDLVDVVVTDDIEGEICTVSLAVGEVTTCTLTGMADVGLYENLGSVTGNPVDEDGEPAVDENGEPVPSPSDIDPSGYEGSEVFGFSVGCPASGPGLEMALGNSTAGTVDLQIFKNGQLVTFTTPSQEQSTTLVLMPGEEQSVIVPFVEGETANLTIENNGMLVAGADATRNCDPSGGGGGGGGGGTGGNSQLANTGAMSMRLGRIAGWLIVLGGLFLALVGRREDEALPAMVRTSR